MRGLTAANPWAADCCAPLLRLSHGPRSRRISSYTDSMLIRANWPSSTPNRRSHTGAHAATRSIHPAEASR